MPTFLHTHSLLGVRDDDRWSHWLGAHAFLNLLRYVMKSVGALRRLETPLKLR